MTAPLIGCGVDGATLDAVAKTPSASVRLLRGTVGVVVVGAWAIVPLLGYHAYTNEVDMPPRRCWGACDYDCDGRVTQRESEICAERRPCNPSCAAGSQCQRGVCVAPPPLRGCSPTCEAGAQCRNSACLTLPLAAVDATFVDRRGGVGWGDRCVVHLRAAALDYAEAACARGLATARRPAVRGALFYNLGLIFERRGKPDAARDYYRRSLAARPRNPVVEHALAALGVEAQASPFDVDAAALEWWRHNDNGARDRLVANGLTPVLVRATASLSVRAGPGVAEPCVRSLPEGTIVVALLGAFGGIPSQAGRGNWSRVVASETLTGWVASGITREYRGCTPEPDALLAQVTPDRAAVVRRDILLSRLEGASASALFLLTARDPADAASYVGLFAADRHCRLDPRRVLRLDGEIEDAFITWTAQEGGEPLIGAGVRAFGVAGVPTSWIVWSVGAPEPVWRATVPTAKDIPDSQRGRINAPDRTNSGPTQGWWPVSIRRPGQAPEYYAWTGSTLEVSATTDPALGGGTAEDGTSLVENNGAPTEPAAADAGVPPRGPVELMIDARRAYERGEPEVCSTLIERALAAGAPAIALQLQGDCLRRVGRNVAALRAYQGFCRLAPGHPAISEVRTLAQGLGGTCP